jgi:DNA polymerase-3 subunit gamma/tau
MPVPQYVQYAAGARMPSEVLYRKWRPQRFADVAGQEAVKRTLLNALKNGKVSHAYLFAGPRGTGKTTMGRLLTKAINCERNAPGTPERSGEPCNECASCVAFNEGRALDLVELDGASNRGIDQVRELREKVGFAPMAGGEAHKVYLIDEVHMLTDQAFNALLKTLEEPPPHIVFILATTDSHRMPATIVSRCQRQEFKRIPVAAIVDRLAYIAGQESIDVPREGLELIARASTGSLRDAINLLEQICDQHGTEPSLEAVREGLGLVADERAADLVTLALRDNLAGALSVIGAARDDGVDLRQFQKDVVMRLRELLLVLAGAHGDGALTPEQVDDMRASVEGVPQEKILRLLKLLALADLKQDPLSPLPLELAVAEALAAPAPAPTPTREPAAAPRAAASPQRPPPRASEPRPAARPQPPPRPAGPPPELRRDNITGASPEDIARMVGSNAPVIPEASGDEPQPAPAAAAAPSNGGSDGAVDLPSFVDKQLRPAARKRSPKFDAFLNGSCHALTWESGVLTLGFYEDGFHKKNVESNLALYEELASTILGARASIRCTMTEKPGKAIKSALVQHAVENLGAKIVSQE